MRLTSIIYILVFSSLITINAQNNPQPAGKEPPPAKVPNTEVGDIAEEFISAINSGDSLAVASFVNKFLQEDLANIGSVSWTKEKYARLLLNLQKQSGSIIAMDVRQNNSPLYLGVVFQAVKANRMFSLEFMKQENANGLRYMELHSMPASSGPYKWTEEKLGGKELADAIEARVQKELASGQFSGNVLIAKGGTIIMNKSYGYRDRENKIENDAMTRFHTGSIGKMITAAAIGQLVEKNMLKFSDTIKTYLKDYPNKDAAAKVTIHQLLTHTAGIADPFELGRRKEGGDYSTPKNNFPLFADAPLTMEPGSYHSYSNGNFAVLAAIVESVSGITFEEYLRKNVFIPARMKLADPDSYAALPRAISYSFNPEFDPLGLNSRTPAKRPETEPQFEYSGFSNVYLTAEDVYAFLLAFREGKIVSQDMVETLTTGKVEVQPGMPAKYAYGFYDITMWGVNMRGHSGGGGNSGIGAEAEMLWNNNYYVIVLGNYDLDVIRPLTFSITRFLGKQ